VRNYKRDEGRSFEVGMQVQISNRPKRLWSICRALFRSLVIAWSRKGIDKLARRNGGRLSREADRVAGFVIRRDSVPWFASVLVFI